MRHLLALLILAFATQAIAQPPAKPASLPFHEFSRLPEREWTGLVCKPRFETPLDAYRSFWSKPKKGTKTKTFKGKLKETGGGWIAVAAIDGRYYMQVNSLDKASMDYVTSELAKVKEQADKRKVEEDRRHAEKLKRDYDRQ